MLTIFGGRGSCARGLQGCSGVCREKIRWVKAPQELDLAAAVKDIKNCSATKSSAKGMIKSIINNFRGVGNTREPFKEERDRPPGYEGI